MNNKPQFIGTGALILAALIWGTAFIPTRYLGAQGISVFLELLVRYSVPLLIFGILSFKQIRKTPKELIKKCMLTGLILFSALTLSIYGVRAIKYGSMGLLLISLNVVFVPLYFVICKQKRISLLLIVAVILSLLGSVLLTYSNLGFSFDIGTVFCFLASLCYTAYIILCSKILTEDIPANVLQFFQSMTFVILCIPLAIITQSFDANINFSDTNLYLAFAFIGIFAGTFAYKLFFYGQKVCEPTVTALILSSQVVFSALADFILFKIDLGNMQILAYIMIICAIILVPINDMRKINK